MKYCWDGISFCLALMSIKKNWCRKQPAVSETLPTPRLNTHFNLIFLEFSATLQGFWLVTNKPLLFFPKLLLSYSPFEDLFVLGGLERSAVLSRILAVLKLCDVARWRDSLSAINQRLRWYMCVREPRRYAGGRPALLDLRSLGLARYETLCTLWIV